MLSGKEKERNIVLANLMLALSQHRQIEKSEASFGSVATALFS